MGTSFVVADIITDIARTANVPTFTASTNVTTSQVNYWLYQSARSLSALFRQKLGEDADFVTTAEITVQAGFRLASLPTDCGEVHAVLWKKSASDLYLMDTADIDAFEDGGDPDTDWEKPPLWRLEGNTVAVYPLPLTEQTLVVYYTNHLSLAASTFVARVDSDRWLALDVAAKVLAAKQRDYSMVQQEKLLLQADMFSTNRRRDFNAVSTIRDTRTRRLRTLSDNWRRGA